MSWFSRFVLIPLFFVAGGLMLGKALASPGEPFFWVMTALNFLGGFGGLIRLSRHEPSRREK